MENYGNKIIQLLNHVGQIILVNLLWLICCTPVITMAGATSSFYYATIKSIRKGRGYPWKEFFHSFLRTLLQGMILTFLFVLAGAGVFFGREAAGDMQSIAGVYLLMFYDALAVLLLGIFFFSCINLSRFYMKTGKLLRFSTIMALRHLPEMLLVSGGTLGICFAFVKWNVPIFCILVVPGIAVYFLTFLIEPVLKKYMVPVNQNEDSKQSESKEDLWYLE